VKREESADGRVENGRRPKTRNGPSERRSKHYDDDAQMPSPHCDHLRVGGLFEVEYNRSETHRNFLDLLQA